MPFTNIKKLLAYYKNTGRKSGSGFTLIEIVIVFTVMLVILAIVISNYPKTNLQFSLSRVAYKFEQDVRRAQDLNSSGIQQNVSGSLQNMYGYGVRLNLSALGTTQYQIYADLNDSKVFDGTSLIIDTIDFSAAEPGIIIKEIDNTNGSGTQVSLDFSHPNFLTTINPPLSNGQTSVNIVFALASNPTTIKTVSISASGLVEVK